MEENRQTTCPLAVKGSEAHPPGMGLPPVLSFLILNQGIKLKPR